MLTTRFAHNRFALGMLAAACAVPLLVASAFAADPAAPAATAAPAKPAATAATAAPAAAGTAAAPAAPAAPAKPATGGGMWKDLQILPKNISKDELKKTMKSMSKDLGVDCSFCHEEPIMEKDTNKKKLAREMMQMTRDINAKYASTMKKVTCWTCHRGKEEPDKQK